MKRSDLNLDTVYADNDALLRIARTKQDVLPAEVSYESDDELVVVHLRSIAMEWDAHLERLHEARQAADAAAERRRAAAAVQHAKMDRLKALLPEGALVSTGFNRYNLVHVRLDDLLSALEAR